MSSDILSSIPPTQKPGTLAYLPTDRRRSRDSTPSPATSERSSKALQCMCKMRWLANSVQQTGDLPMLCAHGGNSLCTLYCWDVGSSAETSPPLWCPAISGGERGYSKIREYVAWLSALRGDFVCECVKDYFLMHIGVVFWFKFWVCNDTTLILYTEWIHLYKMASKNYTFLGGTETISLFSPVVLFWFLLL